MGAERANLHSFCWLPVQRCGYKSQNNWDEEFDYYLQANPLLQHTLYSHRGNCHDACKVKDRTRTANTYSKISVHLSWCKNVQETTQNYKVLKWQKEED